MWLLPSLCCHHCCVMVRHSLTQKGGRTTWPEINSCHGMLGLQPGTRGELLPCFPSSLFTYLTQQKQHKPGKQDRFPDHLEVYISRLQVLPPCQISSCFTSCLQVVHSLTHLWSPILWGSSGLPCHALHCDHLLSFPSTHLLSQLYREKRSFGFDIHNILILYFVLGVTQR